MDDEDAPEADRRRRTVEADDGEGRVVAGPDAVERLRCGADDPTTFHVGVAADGGGAPHATVARRTLGDGLVVTGGPDERAEALLSNLAWQAVAGGAGGAVLARGHATAAQFARALPEDRVEDLRVVGGPDGRSVNLLDPGVPPSSAAFFEAVDAVTDALTSLLVVVATQLRDAVREFVVAARSAGADTSLVELRDFVRYGLDGDDAAVPAWVPDRSPDLLDRVAAVDDEALSWFLDSLAPFLEEPVRSLIADPDPDASLVGVVRSGDPLVAHLDPDTYGADTWRAVGRALTHGCWAAAREFVPERADHPFYLVGDAFGPVLDAEPSLDRLFARLHRDRVVPVVRVEAPGELDPAAWEYLASAVGAHATFGTDDPDECDRIAAPTGLGGDDVASLPAGQCWWTAGDEQPRRVVGYPAHPPRRSAPALPWRP